MIFKTKNIKNLMSVYHANFQHWELWTNLSISLELSCFLPADILTPNPDFVTTERMTDVLQLRSSFFLQSETKLHLNKIHSSFIIIQPITS